MAKGKQSTVIKQRPLTGPFDARSEPEEIPKDGWRMLQNIGCMGIGGRLCRMPGWSRLFPVTGIPYNNSDLHDQLLSLQTYYETGVESVQTSGVLTVGRQYQITTFVSGDNFTNVGASSNATGVTFVATGTTPTTWTNSSTLTALVYTDDSTVLAYPPNNDVFSAYCGTVLKTRPQGRQPITFLAQIESSASTRRLVAGTQSRLYALNERGGNWRIIGDGFGGTTDNAEIRWRHTRVGDYVLFSNNYDEVQYWPYDAPASGCALQAVKPIPELRTINVTKAKVLLEFRGIIILANLEEDGQRKTNMVRWSGLAAPLEWIEDPGVSTAGHQELDYGEEVLAGGVIGNFAFLYTNRGVWQIAVSADPAIVFDMRKVYSSDTGESCIKYPNTFISLGDAHIYMADDAIYTWSQYSPKPERLEWIHRASQILYEEINSSNCATHTAGFDPLTKQLYFSVALREETLPSITLVCNTQYRQAYQLDHGFSAFTAYVPDGRPSIRDFFVENCLLPSSCFDSDEAAEQGAVDLKQGAVSPLNTDCTAYPSHIYTGVGLDTGIDTEESEGPNPILNYEDFEKWDLSEFGGDDSVDLIGEGACATIDDVLPGNGVYLRVQHYGGAVDKYMTSKTSFAIASGSKYRLTVRAAGSQVSSNNTVQLSISLPAITHNFTRNWFDPISTTVKEWVSSATTATEFLEMQFRQTDADFPYGPCIFQVTLQRISAVDGSVLATLFTDDFSTDNITSCDSLFTEDYTQAEASSDSMCALMGDTLLNDLCRKCDSASVFIAASASDWCLKQIGTVFYRERHVADGVYAQDGYRSRMLKCLPGNSSKIALSRVLLQFNAEIQAVPLKMNLRVGAAVRATDPLRDCAIQWNDEGGRDVDCVNNDKSMEWLVWASDSFIFLDFTIDGIGGASCYSSMELELQPDC